MIISETDALWAADQFISYFKRFETIEDYIRVTKEAAVNERGKSIVSLKDEFFNEDVHPEEMDLRLDLLERDSNSLYLKHIIMNF